MSDKEAPPADEYGLLMHTALRKLCDSRPTSIAWNIIHLAPATWTSFSDAVAEAKARDGADVLKVYKAFEMDGPAWNRGGDSLYAVQIFRMAFDDFTWDDWNGMAAYLSE
jgi:hypothetical protein